MDCKVTFISGGYIFLNNIFIGFVVLELAQFLLKYLLRYNKNFNCDF